MTHKFQHLLHYFTTQQSGAAKIRHPDGEVHTLSSTLSNLREAAVLIPIVQPQDQSAGQIIMTVRSDQLKSHAGQVSLPGGTWEPQDADLVATALRESEEEIALSSDAVRILGQLGSLSLPSGFRITPVIGLIESVPELSPCPIEVAEIFTIPLDIALDAGSYRSAQMHFNGKSRKILELVHEEYRIWGATAAILHHLASEIADSRK